MGAATYHAIVGNVWDRTFRHLSRDAKVVAFNVWTSPLSRSEGLFELAVGHIAADTGLAVAEVEAALEELTVAGLVDYDAGAELVLDRRAAKACQLKMGTNKETGKPQPDNRITSAVSHFKRLPASPLKETFRQLIAEGSPALAEALPPPDEAPSPAPSKPLAHKPLRRSEEEQGQGLGYEEGKGRDRCEVCGDYPCLCSPMVRRRYEEQTGERLAL